jgi:hypothetical protein
VRKYAPNFNASVTIDVAIDSNAILRVDFIVRCWIPENVTRRLMHRTLAGTGSNASCHQWRLRHSPATRCGVCDFRIFVDLRQSSGRTN